MLRLGERDCARDDHAIGGRKVALQEFRRRVVTRDANVEAREQQPRQRAGQLGREDPLGGRVKATHVERTGVAQRGARGARLEGLVNVYEIERDGGEHALDRARHVEWERGRSAPGKGEGQNLADTQHEGLSFGALEQRVWLSADRAAARANQVRRLRGGQHEHAVTPLRELAGYLCDVLVNLVRRLPRERRHLRDREALYRHGWSLKPGSSALERPAGCAWRRACAHTSR